MLYVKLILHLTSAYFQGFSGNWSFPSCFGFFKDFFLPNYDNLEKFMTNSDEQIRGCLFQLFPRSNFKAYWQ